MKILFYRYGSICEPDIIDGFCELGNEVVTITEEIYNKNLLPSEGVALLNETLQKASYDFVFSINFYPFISEVCNIFQYRVNLQTRYHRKNGKYHHPWQKILLFSSALDCLPVADEKCRKGCSGKIRYTARGQREKSGSTDCGWNRNKVP